MIQCENSFGEALHACKDTILCSGGENFENCRYSRGENAKNIWDVS